MTTLPMAALLLVPSSLAYFKYSSQTANRKLRHVRTTVSNEKIHDTSQTARIQVQPKSGNYQACIWDYDFLLSLDKSYKDCSFKKNIDELKKQVKQLVEDEDSKPLTRLELIDNINRLGPSCHFENEIACFLE